MGQKVNPHGMRVGIIRGWDAQWYAAKKDFSKYLVEDYRIRTFLKKKYYQSAISKILIDRSASKLSVVIFTARPGVIIGKAGAGVEIIKGEIAKLCQNKATKISISIMEVRRPDTDAQLTAENIAAQLEKRIQFRRAMKQAMQRAVKAGARGIKTMVAGRLDGAEIARSEHYHEGSIPLHTLRADIDYGFAEAHTTFGVIGVKVWIYKGEILRKTSNVREGGDDNVNA
jgi:small subunit ribosomal protein S3